MNDESLQSVMSLLDSTNEASLGTLEEGHPFVSATGFIFEKGETGLLPGKIYMLLSELARHTRNIKLYPRISLLIVQQDPSLAVHEKKRMTLQGTVSTVTEEAEHERLRNTYLEVFPRSQVFFTLPDFCFYALEPEEIHWIAGFGKAGTLK